ncbi:MAG: GntR family transcriptional regulator [Bacteroidales bacterium]|nr:GntR family transcriptional regulator [Bacteroidales bacterium]
MIEIGRYNELRILRQASVGLYLGDESGEDVLLPNKYCSENMKIEDKIEVFVYRDFAERKVATNLIPKILINEFALLQVTAVSDVGAFMDWGLEKDLMVPFREQRQKMEEGRWYIVYLDLDKKTDRLYASNKIEKFLQNDVVSLKEGEEVELLVLHKTDLGYSAIVNSVHKGLIFENEIFKELNIGDKLNGYVKKIREDNKIDISIQPIGYKNFNDANSELIYNTLLENEGFLAITDSSTPDEIYAQFGISKKAFKKSIGALYKQRKITIQPEGIKLI